MPETVAGQPMKRLCAVEDIFDGKARDFDIELAGVKQNEIDIVVCPPFTCRPSRTNVRKEFASAWTAN